MAEDDKKERNLPPRDFVDALVEDPANPPQLQVFTGYRGRSAQEGHTRLYIDPELSGWVDIPEDAILYQRESQDEYGLGKSLVWTRLDAQIQMGPQAGGGTGADFLQGQVAQDLGGGIGAGVKFLPTPPRLCPSCPPSVVIARCPTAWEPNCLRSAFFPCITQQFPCPTRDPNQCVLETANPQQCPSVGITCTALPPCPPRTVNPEQCPSLGITCTALAPCPTRDPNQCVLETANPQQCPSLGITCTALPPCPPRTVPPACPQTPGIACVPSVLIACPPITQDPRQCVLQTQNVAQCIPQPTSNPQLCPVATPNPGCIPGGGPGGPGGPVEGGQQGVQGFADQLNLPNLQVTPWLRTPVIHCPTLWEPQCLRTIWEPQCQRTIWEPQCLRTILEPHCFQVTPPITITITTPQFGTPQLGGFGGAQDFGAQGGMGAEAVGAGGVAVTQACPQTQFCPSRIAACTQFCPAPNTAQLTCPVTRNIQCFTSRMCPRSTFCPSVGVPCQTGAVCQPVTLGCPFGGGGGGFEGGF